HATKPVGSATPGLGVIVAVRVNVVLKLLGSGVATSVPVTGVVVTLLTSTVMPPVFTSALGARLSEDFVAAPSANTLESVAPPLPTTRSGVASPLRSAI